MTQINTENSPALSANQATHQVNNQVNNQVTDTDTQGSNTTSQQPNSNMGNNVDTVSYTHLTLPTTPYV